MCVRSQGIVMMAWIAGALIALMILWYLGILRFDAN
jgi:hypothetical protein